MLTFDFSDLAPAPLRVACALPFRRLFPSSPVPAYSAFCLGVFPDFFFPPTNSHASSFASPPSLCPSARTEDVIDGDVSSIFFSNVLEDSFTSRALVNRIAVERSSELRAA